MKNLKERRRASSYDVVIPVPHDKRGVEIRIGPLRVLQRTDGRYFVYDERRPFAENTVYLAVCGREGLIEGILEMVRLARDEGLPVPEAPPRRAGGPGTNARGSGA